MPLSFLEPLRDRRHPWLLAAAVALAAAVMVGAIAWYTLREAPPLFAAKGADAGGSGEGGETDAVDTGAADAAADPAPPPIFIHVAGAVATPGVYALSDGQRVIDAVLAAGGGTAEAALDSINLAQPLVDGQRLYVPTKREAQGIQPGATYSGGKPFTPPGGSGAGAAGGGPLIVNLNTATEAELDAIPDIGPVLAARIVLYRTANGPFRTVDDLTKVSGIGDKTLQELKPYLTVK